MNDVMKKLQDAVRWFRERPVSSTSSTRGAPRNLLRRFKDLPTALKAVIVVVGALLLLTVLSPLGLVVARLLLVLGVVALMLRVARRRLAKGWGTVGVVSLVLALVFGGISNALYGGESGESTGVGGGAKERGTKEKNPPDYEVDFPPGVPNGYGAITLAQATIKSDTDKEHLPALCEALAADWPVLYPRFDAVRIAIKGTGTGKGGMMYFRNEAVKREYDRVYKIYNQGLLDYSTYCYA